MGSAPMKRHFPILLLSLIVLFSPSAALAQQPRFRVLAFYSTNVEPDHVLFAEGALKFFSEVANKNNFTFDSTTHWDDMNDSNLGKYQLVVWLNDEAASAEQKRAFQKYIENRDAWLGFHVAACNDKDSNYRWFGYFLCRRAFHINISPPLPSMLTGSDRAHPMTMGLARSCV